MTDVAGEVISHEQIQGLGGDVPDIFAERTVEFFHEIRDQRRDVLAPTKPGVSLLLSVVRTGFLLSSLLSIFSLARRTIRMMSFQRQGLVK